MPVSEVKFKDKDGFTYKHPNQSCKRCLKYPCISKMENLKGDFAKYGCKNYQDVNTFDTWKPKR